MRQTHRPAAVAAISCLVLLTGVTGASALSVAIRDFGLTGHPTLLINDNDASDSNPTVGLIDFSGTIGRGFVISGLHADGRVGGSTYPDLYFRIDRLGWTGISTTSGIQFEVGDSDYSYQNNVVTKFVMSGAAGAGVTLSADSDIAYTNTDISFTTFDDQHVGAFHITPGGPFDERIKTPIAYRAGDPFAVQQVVRISGTTEGAVSNLELGTSPIPIGPSLPLLLGAVAGLGLLRRRARG